ncbi:hypothetical protein KR032_008894, partial [Drosophila birchii]
NQKRSAMFKSLREMSVSKLSGAIVVGIFRYFQLMGVFSFQLIQNDDGYTVCNQNWLIWISAVARFLALCGFAYLVGLNVLSMKSQSMMIIHGIRFILSIPGALLIVGYQFFHGNKMIKLINRFLRLFRKVRNLNKSKRSGFGSLRELVLILLKVACLGHEFSYQWLMDISFNTEFFIEWMCNTYIIVGSNIFMHIYCLVYLSLGAICCELNNYTRNDLAPQLEALNPPISRKQRRIARCQLENCLALYREIHAVNAAFQEFFEIPLVVALGNKIMLVAAFGYRVINVRDFASYSMWVLIVKHILDLLLLTLSVEGAKDQSKVIRRLNLEVYRVSDLPEFHTMLEIFYTHLNLYQIRVRIWGLCEVSNELFIIYMSALLSWMVFIAQYTMQMKNV